eukprot:comp11474_c0_seq1/m.5916 comp11474_c0_seq1/g.5916  ORF comp11474_c0_seq1/g.5916 comp11474_c0_seq1/m.5916 type:complete len:312 (+) comp11474_c0_seq1:234-1169(+)
MQTNSSHQTLTLRGATFQPILTSPTHLTSLSTDPLKEVNRHPHRLILRLNSVGVAPITAGNEPMRLIFELMRSALNRKPLLVDDVAVFLVSFVLLCRKNQNGTFRIVRHFDRDLSRVANYRPLQTQLGASSCIESHPPTPTETNRSDVFTSFVLEVFHGVLKVILNAIERPAANPRHEMLAILGREIICVPRLVVENIGHTNCESSLRKLITHTACSVHVEPENVVDDQHAIRGGGAAHIELQARGKGDDITVATSRGALCRHNIAAFIAVACRHGADVVLCFGLCWKCEQGFVFLQSDGKKTDTETTRLL